MVNISTSNSSNSTRRNESNLGFRRPITSRFTQLVNMINWYIYIISYRLFIIIIIIIIIIYIYILAIDDIFHIHPIWFHHFDPFCLVNWSIFHSISPWNPRPLRGVVVPRWSPLAPRVPPWRRWKISMIVQVEGKCRKWLLPLYIRSSRKWVPPF